MVSFYINQCASLQDREVII